MKTPQNLLLAFTLVTSTIMSLSSTNLLSAWVGLELNMLSFIPMILEKKTTSEAETSVKYLIPQSVGSTIFMTASMLQTFTDLSNSLMTTALLLKLGAAPFHSWFPAVMQLIDLKSGLILMTWQKLMPISLLLNSTDTQTPLIQTTAMLSAICGSTGGLNQTNLRTLMSFSSIAHLSWILASTSLNTTTTLLYLALYSANTTPIFLALMTQQSTVHKTLLSFKTTKLAQLSIALNLLSLAGLPPLMGFSAKLMVLIQLKEHLTLISILIVGTAISLYFYLMLTLSVLTNLPNTTTPNDHYITMAISTFLPQSLSLPMMLTSTS
uniref:NADH-ubiquinone oxidoreductase chain 2 n=1 Tax=Margaritifera margaritifera TaxID=2505931 RepID=A0A4Y5QT42_9BIVA|nr:NADH dehydrogenase subunit 2 [Margaritifera margaritifera]